MAPAGGVVEPAATAKNALNLLSHLLTFFFSLKAGRKPLRRSQEPGFSQWRPGDPDPQAYSYHLARMTRSVSSSLRQSEGWPESDVVVPLARLVPEAVDCAAVPGVVEPAAAAIDAPCFIISVPICGML